MVMQFEDVLDFWFGADSDGTPAQETIARWFKRDDAFDTAIAQQFGATLIAARGGELDAWSSTPGGWLALLIVLDQFPRNIHRGCAQAFASDLQAQRTALDGLSRSDDERLHPIQRLFCYLPLEHAEDLVLQQRSVDLFAALRDAVAPAERKRFDGFLDYALRHQAVIQRFGRFPHRNEALGRASTEAERAYMAQPGTGF